MNNSFKYLVHNPDDESWGMYLNVAGIASVALGADYPPKGHPRGYNFNWENGRILQEYQLNYITEGEGILETVNGEFEIKEGSVLLIRPNQWHRYRPLKNRGWIGSPSTAQYLMELSEVFKTLAKRQPFTLRVIGGGIITIPGVEIESIPWSLNAEAALIAECDIGIMPLRDTPWEQGKCGYKLIQYMASGLPTVASPIGANLNITIEDKTGFFAATDTDWVDRLELLLCDAALRQRLGQTGRARIEKDYCLQQVAPRIVRLVTEAGLH